MKHLEPLQDLFGDFHRVRLRLTAGLHVVAEVAVLDVLHRDEYFVLVFVPPAEPHKQVVVLSNVSQPKTLSIGRG